MDNNRLRVAGQEIPRVAVELPAAQDDSDLHEGWYGAVVFDFGQLALQKILIHLADQCLGSLVFDQGIGAL